MIVKRLNRALLALVILNAILDLSLIVWLNRLHYVAAHNLAANLVATNRNSYIKSPDGFRLDGKHISPISMDKAGWTVRYAARDCQSCRADEARWLPLARALMNENYDVRVLIPGRADAFPSQPPGITQVGFVNLEWIGRYRLTRTPTVLIFDREKGLIWSHEGTLDGEDQEDALSTVRAAKHRH